MAIPFAKAFSEPIAGLDFRVGLLTGGQVVVAVGRGILLPFTTLYFYAERGFPLTLVTLAIAIALPLGSVLGLAWGAFADRIGRRPVLLAGLAVQVASTLGLAFVDSIPGYFAAVIANSIGGTAWAPAARAMAADVTPPEARTRVFGLLYLAHNFGLSGGLLLGASLVAFLPFRALFLFEAAGLLAFLLLVVARVPESLVRAVEGSADGPRPVRGGLRTLVGATEPLRDGRFAVFLAASVLGGMGFTQFFSMYGPFLRDVLGAPPFWIGAVLAVNTVLVVVLQLPVATWAERRPRTRVLLYGHYVLAWSLLLTWVAGRAPGLTSALLLLVLAVALMTVAEVLVAPVGSALATGLAGRETNFGKYLAAVDLMWALAQGLGALVGGAFFDAGAPRLLWPSGAAVVAFSLLGFALLSRLLPHEVNHPAGLFPPASVEEHRIPA